ncbi:MAG: DUF599 domain-containing protein [Rhodobacteraceae bacterium]|jgi:uncharacterized membrane protein|uniref:DUF599 domain-containing protein n=1 Tax=Albidovulum sp. TaxID=1872424 RepID=UPI001D8B1555|nr:DUF599 domain-containing protein [uncultured Defluviimonas sp.]MCB2125035.1 DUF599 domain-containing protein [Paracoccaceae bacterium]MCC0071600.1 DUF599 domain-containing protein [Paracoccaceae bacterium]
MTDLISPSDMTTADMAALGFLLLGWLVFGFLVEHPPRSLPSVSALMTAYRREWMRQFVTRQPRIFDASVMDSLRQGTSFLASATMIAIGGGVALIGNTERLLGLAEDLTLASAPAAVLEAKIIVILLFLTNAFLKFLWSHRLFGYCAIVMAAVPNETDDPSAFHRAGQAAQINISAARSFNRGLRAVYFALAALAWILGPLALTMATAVTLAVLWRREFASVSRRVLMDGTPK